MSGFYVRILLFFCLATALPLFSQNETTKWYFGAQAGLDFMTSPPTTLTNSAMWAPAGCASIADAAGNLLFYTDGAVVFNAAHTVMANGTGLFGMGNFSGGQGTIILKRPGSNTLFYIFSACTSGFSQGFNYSIVDMSLASGQGSVVAKNVNLFPGLCSPNVTATKHCNGVDIWVVTRDLSNNVSSLNSTLTINFQAFLLTSAGVNTTAVVSPGSVFTFSNFAWYDYGCMKLSPNGQFLGKAYNFSGSQGNNYLTNNPNARFFELWKFDNTTGAVTNSLVLLYNTYNNITHNGNLGALGCEFSPDGTKFYGGCFDDFAAGNFDVYQWDLCAGSPSAVVSSPYIMSTAGVRGQLQLAADGKIYCVKNGNTALDVINNPNLAGSSCNYSVNAVSISPKTGYWALPNFMSSLFLQRPTLTPFTYTVGNSPACWTTAFTSTYVPNTIVVGCAFTGYSLNAMQWDFGDSASGSNNISFAPNPTHAFSANGIYTVQLVLYYSCGGGTDTLKQVVNINQPCISVVSKSITCASLGSATVTPVGGVGPFNYTWMPTAQTNSVANGLSPGTYTVTVFDSGSNLSYTAGTVFTSLIPLTGSLTNASSITCHGANTGTATVINLAGGSGNQFYTWTNGTLTYTNSFVNNLSAGVWSVTVTDALTGCNIHQSFIITQPAVQNLVTSASSQTACVNHSVVLTSANSGGTPFLINAPYTYSWSGGPTTPAWNVSASSPGPVIYSLTARDSLNCPVTSTISVTYINNPVISVSSISICPLQTGTLIPAGATTYTWNGTTTVTNFTDSPSAATVYTVVGTALGCTAAATATIDLFSSPSPLINSNSPVCNGKSLELSGSGGVIFQWSGPAGFASGLASPTINPATPSNSGTYTLIVTSVDGCTATVSSPLTVNPTPSLTATGASVCTSQTLNLSASSDQGAAYSWSGPINFYSGLQSPSLSSLSINQSGIYTVVATSSLNCTNLATVHVLVVAPPGLTANLNSTLLCSQAFNGSQNSTTLSAGGANTYTLATEPDMTILNPGGPVSPLTVIPPYSGPGTATVWGSNGICTVFTTLSFSIIPNPTVAVSPTPVICAGESFTYTSQGASSYTWSGATPGFTTYNNGGVAVAHPSINSVFSVFGGSLGCFSASKTSTITVNPLPEISISPLQPTVCLYKSAYLTASGTATAYLWTSAPGLFNGSGPTVSVSPLSQQIYTVTGELDNCFASATTTVNVRALPEPTINTNKISYCANEAITLSGEGGLIYEWRGPNNLYYQKQVISWQSPGGSGGMSWAGGIYSLTVTDGNGCQATATKQLTVYDLPQGSLSGYKESGCVPLCTQYDFRGTNSGVSGNWTINHQSFGDQFSYCFPEAGSFTITGRINDKTTGCDNQLNFVVRVYPKPDADFNYLPLHPVENLDEVKFTNTSTGKNQISWNWHFLNNSGYQSSGENTSFLFTEPGEYPIAFVVSDQNFCQDTVMKVISVEPDFTLYIPDAFTPNGDELNDVFKPVVRSSYLYTLSVFDRWGQRIFYSTSPQSGWDGTFQGAECKMDVYSYKIVLSTVAGAKKEYTGHVSLVR